MPFDFLAGLPPHLRRFTPETVDSVEKLVAMVEDPVFRQTYQRLKAEKAVPPPRTSTLAARTEATRRLGATILGSNPEEIRVAPGWEQWEQWEQTRERQREDVLVDYRRERERARRLVDHHRVGEDGQYVHKTNPRF